MKIGSPELENNPDCQDVDDCNIRLFSDPFQRFSRDSPYDITKEPPNIPE